MRRAAQCADGIRAGLTVWNLQRHVTLTLRELAKRSTIRRANSDDDEIAMLPDLVHSDVSRPDRLDGIVDFGRVK